MESPADNYWPEPCAGMRYSAFSCPSDCCAHTIELIVNRKYIGISLANIISR